MMPDYELVVIRANTAGGAFAPDDFLTTTEARKNMTGHWRDRAATSFHMSEQPAGRERACGQQSSLASRRGAEMLAAGGNAIDAAMRRCSR